MLAIGGWGGSKYFSPAVTTDANRTAFAKAVMGVVSQYGLDGIEFEYALLALSFQIFKFSFTHRFIAGNTPPNKELAATSYPRMTAPISSYFCKHFVLRTVHRI